MASGFVDQWELADAVMSEVVGIMVAVVGSSDWVGILA